MTNDLTITLDLSRLMDAADKAARQIPPLWPLASHVAVNPYLGQTGSTLAARRQVVERAGKLIVVDEPDRMHWQPDDRPHEVTVRFRTLGCWPVTAATPSEATTLEEIAMDTFAARTSERQGRISDNGSLEQQKRSGYF